MVLSSIILTFIQLPVSFILKKLGVDLSKTLGIHVVAVRFFVLLFKPLGLGLIFYFIYYWFIINKVFIPLLTPEHEIQITKIKSYYFGS